MQNVKKKWPPPDDGALVHTTYDVPRPLRGRFTSKLLQEITSKNPEKKTRKFGVMARPIKIEISDKN